MSEIQRYGTFHGLIWILDEGHPVRPTDMVRYSDHLAVAEELKRQIRELRSVIEATQRIVDEQAEDGGIWFSARTAPEAYLQQELRHLHCGVENLSARLKELDAVRACEKEEPRKEPSQ